MNGSHLGLGSVLISSHSGSRPEKEGLTFARTAAVRAPLRCLRLVWAKDGNFLADHLSLCLLCRV